MTTTVQTTIQVKSGDKIKAQIHLYLSKNIHKKEKDVQEALNTAGINPRKQSRILNNLQSATLEEGKIIADTLGCLVSDLI